MYGTPHDNSVSLYAGEEGGQMSLEFSGNIQSAYMDAQAMPQVCFRLSALPGGGVTAVKPAEPISKKGPQIAERGVLATVPPGKSREGDPIEIKPPKMIGYPAFREAVVVVRALWDPAVKVGAEIKVTSDVTPACGTWRSIRIVDELESMTPHGRWQMTIDAVSTQSRPTPP
jgi:hypothetical protein